MHKKLNGEKLKIEFEKLNEKHFDQIIAIMNSEFEKQSEICPQLLDKIFQPLHLFLCKKNRQKNSAMVAQIKFFIIE